MRHMVLVSHGRAACCEQAPCTLSDWNAMPTHSPRELKDGPPELPECQNTLSQQAVGAGAGNLQRLEGHLRHCRFLKHGMNCPPKHGLIIAARDAALHFRSLLLLRSLFVGTCLVYSQPGAMSRDNVLP